MVNRTGPGDAGTAARITNVINLSNTTLNSDQLEVLGLGLSFIPTPHPRYFSTDALLGDFGTLCETHMARYSIGLPETAQRVKQSVCRDIEQDLTRARLGRSDPNLSPRLRKALRELRDMKDLVISTADKGDAVVVLDVDHYTGLAWAHLSDDETYSLLSEDPTPIIVNRLNAYLKRCKADGVIDAGLCDRLKLPDDTSIQHMYFLPKVHKHPLKVRPIVSCSGGPTEGASRYLNGLLQPHARRVDSYVANSIDVVRRLRALTLPSDTTLVSLDVESLYTNITHALAIKAFTKRFESHPKFVFLLDLLRFVLSNNVFEFDGRFFRQTCGIAMGTSLAPALATIVVADLEEEFLASQPYRPLFWIRYIDDILAGWHHSRERLATFLEGLNAADPRLRFTSEQSLLSAVFLDVRIYKPPNHSLTGKLSTSIWYKHTNTFTYAEGSSHIVPHTFRGIAIGETVRALRNSDSRRKFEDVRRKLLHRFSRRNFPPHALRAIKEIGFDQREAYLQVHGGKHLDHPLPLNTLFFRFADSLNGRLTDRWRRVHREPFLARALPTAPFTAFRNHRSLGALLSHKRRKFHSTPTHPTLQADRSTPFRPQRFNRPRRKRDLAKAHQAAAILRSVDRTCDNRRCQVCPRLRHPKFVASTVHQTTHPVDQSITCTTLGIVYCLICRRCGKQYVGETTKCMRARLARHKTGLRTAPMSLYSHFIRYHHVDTLDVDIVLLAKEQDHGKRLTLERQWIEWLGTTIPRGLNNRY